MLQLRRTIAFSERVQNYIVLLFLFFFSLFLSQLWWSVTDFFVQFTSAVSFGIGLIGLSYSLILLLLTSWVFIRHTIVLVPVILATIARSAVFVVGIVIVRSLAYITFEGITLYV